MMEREPGWGGAYGGCCLFMRGGKSSNVKKTKIKYVMALDGQLGYFKCNNQPKTRGRDGAGVWEQVQPGGRAQGGQNHHFGGH